MVRPALLVSVLAAATTLVGWVGPAHAATPVLAEDDLPLRVTITSLSPSVVPTQGPLLISGTITNVSEVTYDEIRVYGLTSTVPITSRAGLATAAESDPAQEVGDRITDVAFSIETLPAGASAAYSLRIPRRLLPLDATTSPEGVYWLGVHALGETTDGRDLVADGKARTFLPLVGSGNGTLDTALVVSLRHPVRYRPDGSIGRLTQWNADLGPGGRLSAMLDLARAAGPRRLTWLVDPAVTDTLTRLAAGNPARWLGRSQEGAPPPTLTGSAPTRKPRTESKEAELARVAAAADDWLGDARTALVGDQLLALPYGDMDVSAAAAWSHGLYRLARERSSGGIAALDLPASPAVAPPGGYLDPSALELLTPSTTALVTDAMLSDRPRRQSPVQGDVDGHRLVFADERAASGGPLPGDPLTPLQERQRILSEAALRLLGGDGPLVVALPDDWDPGTRLDADGFFAGLDVPWLRLTPLRAVTQGDAVLLDAAGLRYPTAEADGELPAASFGAASTLIDTGALVESLLPANHTLAGEARDQAFSGTSYAARVRPTVQQSLARRSSDRLRRLGAQVTVEAPTSVTLSSESGSFSATLTNNLDQRVRVRVVARSDDSLRIKASPVIDLAPGELHTVELTARSSVLGLHDVDLYVANGDGVPLGSSDDFQLRAAQVSDVIWVVFAVGGIFLFSAIAVRLFRRVRGFLRRRRVAS